MRLDALVAALEGVELPDSGMDRDVLALAQDSRQVREGTLFVAVRGFHSDGHRFVPDAVRRGAVAVVAEERCEELNGAVVPVILVKDSRRALARLAASFYGHPTRKLKLVGITGTNGKTTTSYLVKAVIEASGGAAGLIGTIDYRIADRVYPAPNTTPESLDLQRLLAEMAGLDIGYCVMEVSSHALALGRTDGCEFAAAAFTNLTQDHLDFHRDMDAYFHAKLRLFSGLGSGAAAVVNRDDVRADEIMKETKAKVITYGFQANADVRPEGDIRHGIEGLSFTARTPAGSVAVRSPLVGKHNIYNILAAAGIGTALGIGTDAIARGITSMRSVPGRMETVDAGQNFGVIVDYAHTEDALIRLLDAVRDVARGRVITVFGCGGDRDRTKRPKMGAAAAAGSDIVIVTSDNPRTEDPLAIIAEIETGMKERGRRAAGPGRLEAPNGRTPYLVVPDRRKAIEAAVAMASAGDVVVVAGKGHEDYQVVGERKAPFDDREEARRAIRNLRGAGSGMQDG